MREIGAVSSRISHYGSWPAPGGSTTVGGRATPRPPRLAATSPAVAANPGHKALAELYWPSQAFHLSGWASSHFLAASSGFMFFSAMSRATSFWSSLVHEKFFTTATAGLPESANFLDTTLFNL